MHKTTWLNARVLALGAAAIMIVASPALAGEFFEGFEGGTLGQMEPMNIDAGKSSLEASDGYRCQYNDPDWINSNLYVEPGPGNKPGDSDCYLGVSPQHAADFFWNVVGAYGSGLEGRSYRGEYSVWMGAIVETGCQSGKPSCSVPVLTTPMATLEALVTSDPLHIGQDTAELSFKHQISLPDDRVVNCGEGRTSAGGVVQAQVVDGYGNALGPWRTLVPSANAYDAQPADIYFDCMFDPIDDGSTEDDFYDPEDPERRLGPSSLCYDQWVFAYLGNTDLPFDEANVGNATGPGLQGESGLGTWVESRFDLSAYNGSSILIRFLNNGIKTMTAETFEDLFHWNPQAGDDGWFIDDIMVTGTVDAPEAWTADEADISAAAGNAKVLQALPRQ